MHVWASDVYEAYLGVNWVQEFDVHPAVTDFWSPAFKGVPHLPRILVSMRSLGTLVPNNWSTMRRTATDV